MVHKRFALRLAAVCVGMVAAIGMPATANAAQFPAKCKLDGSAEAKVVACKVFKGRAIMILRYPDRRATAAITHAKPGDRISLLGSDGAASRIQLDKKTVGAGATAAETRKEDHRIWYSMHASATVGSEGASVRWAP